MLTIRKRNLKGNINKKVCSKKGSEYFAKGSSLNFASNIE